MKIFNQENVIQSFNSSELENIINALNIAIESAEDWECSTYFGIDKNEIKNILSEISNIYYSSFCK